MEETTTTGAHKKGVHIAVMASPDLSPEAIKEKITEAWGIQFPPEAASDEADTKVSEVFEVTEVTEVTEAKSEATKGKKVVFHWKKKGWKKGVHIAAMASPDLSPEAIKQKFTEAWGIQSPPEAASDEADTKVSEVTEVTEAESEATKGKKVASKTPPRPKCTPPPGFKNDNSTGGMLISQEEFDKKYSWLDDWLAMPRPSHEEWLAERERTRPERERHEREQEKLRQRFRAMPHQHLPDPPEPPKKKEHAYNVYLRERNRAIAAGEDFQPPPATAALEKELARGIAGPDMGELWNKENPFDEPEIPWHYKWIHKKAEYHEKRRREGKPDLSDGKTRPITEEETRNRELCNAAERGKDAEVKKLLSAGADPNWIECYSVSCGVNYQCLCMHVFADATCSQYIHR